MMFIASGFWVVGELHHVCDDIIFWYGFFDVSKIGMNFELLITIGNRKLIDLDVGSHYQVA